MRSVLPFTNDTGGTLYNKSHSSSRISDEIN